MGLYPNRRVIDAAFSVVRDGLQVSVRASALATGIAVAHRGGPDRDRRRRAAALAEPPASTLPSTASVPTSRSTLARSRSRSRASTAPRAPRRHGLHTSRAVGIVGRLDRGRRGAHRDRSRQHVGFTRSLVGDPWRRRAGARSAEPGRAAVLLAVGTVQLRRRLHALRREREQRRAAVAPQRLRDPRARRPGVRPCARHRRPAHVGRADGKRRLQDRVGTRHTYAPRTPRSR